MSKIKIACQGVALLATLAGFPHPAIWTKLAEEIIDSNLALLYELGDSYQLDRADMLKHLNLGHHALNAYFNEEWSLEERNEWLAEAGDKLTVAFCQLDLHPMYQKHCIIAAKSLSFCMMLRGFYDMAEDWANTAVRKNEQYGKPYDHQELLAIKQSFVMRRQLPSS